MSWLLTLEGDELCQAVSEICNEENRKFVMKGSKVAKDYNVLFQDLKDERWKGIVKRIPLKIVHTFGICQETGFPNDSNVAKYLSEYFDSPSTIQWTEPPRSHQPDDFTEIKPSHDIHIHKERESEEMTWKGDNYREHVDTMENNVGSYMKSMEKANPFEHEKDKKKPWKSLSWSSETKDNYSSIPLRVKRPHITLVEPGTSTPRITEIEEVGKYQLRTVVNPLSGYCRTTSPEDCFYSLGTTQFIEGGWSACTTIAFVAGYYLHDMESKEDIIKRINWESIMNDGKRMYDIWKNGPVGKKRSDNQTSLDDVMNIEGMKPLFDDIGFMKVLNGPLYYEQTLNYTNEDRKEWCPLIHALMEFRQFGEDSRKKQSIGILTINGYSISLWTDSKITMIFDSHGSVGERHATVDFITETVSVLKGCLKLTRCPLFWKGKGATALSDQYTFYFSL